MKPSSAIARSTTLRRSRQCSAEVNGDQADGDWMTPAIVAASASVRLLTSLAKNRRAASATPWMANEPRCPRYTSFRYISRISSFEVLRSRMIAMYCSASFRRSDFSGVRKKFLTSCWVIVLPPTRYFFSPRRLVTIAPSVRMRSTPGWS